MNRNGMNVFGLALVVLCSVFAGAIPAVGQLQNSDDGNPNAAQGGRKANVAHSSPRGASSTNPADWLSATLALGKGAFEPGEPILVRFAVTNTSAFAVHLLKWGTPFDGFKRDMFGVTQQGKRVPYTGMLVKRGAPTRADYVEIQPGATVTAVLDLADGYAIQQKGDYAVEFAVALPDVRRDTTGLEAPAAAGGASARTAVRVTTPSLAFVLTGNRASAPAISRKATGFTNCNATQQQNIRDAFQAAQVYVANAIAALQSASNPAQAPRYTTWFGVYDQTRYATVQQHYSTMNTAFSTQGVTGFGWDCASPDCTPGIFAFVFPNSPYNVYLCGAFWSASTTGTDSRAGTLVHESSHFTVIAGTQDYAYGQSAAQSLAQTNPAQAVGNADNHEYFAENEPPLSMGPTVTPTLSPTPTATPSSTATVTATITSTPISTSTPTPTPTGTITVTETATPVGTATTTATPIASDGHTVYLPVVMVDDAQPDAPAARR